MFVNFACTTIRLFETLRVSMGMGGNGNCFLGINGNLVKHEISQGREWEWEKKVMGMGGNAYTKVIPAHLKFRA